VSERERKRKKERKRERERESTQVTSNKYAMYFKAF
jgi:hypothetical protein